jgi:hypothetical protein
MEPAVRLATGGPAPKAPETVLRGPANVNARSALIRDDVRTALSCAGRDLTARLRKATNRLLA